MSIVDTLSAITKAGASDIFIVAGRELTDSPISIRWQEVVKNNGDNGQQLTLPGYLQCVRPHTEDTTHHSCLTIRALQGQYRIRKIPKDKSNKAKYS